MGGSYIDSPDWIKNKKATINHIKKKIKNNNFLCKKRKNISCLCFKKISNSEKQVILLIISNEKGLYYVTVKQLSALLRGITCKNNSDFYCLNRLHSFRLKKKLELHKKVCQNKDITNVIMPSKTLKYSNLINIKNWLEHHLLFMQILNV